MRDVHGKTLQNHAMVGRYLTATGKVGIEVREYHFACGRTTYSYTGKWGAGSRTTRSDVEREISSMLHRHPRHTIDINLFKDN